MADQTKNTFTIIEMLEAIEAEARAEAGTSLAVIARGDARQILSREGLASTLGDIAEASAAASTIEDSIFKGRDVAWETPSDEEARRHRIKWAWRDAICRALQDVQTELKGDADEHTDPPRGEATWEEVCNLVREGRKEPATRGGYMDESGIIHTGELPGQ